MVWLDARLPLRFGALHTRTPDEAVLTDGPRAAAPAAFFEPAPPGTHAQGCACCLPRAAAASALAQLFRDRALANGPAFRAVLAVPTTPEAEAEIRETLRTDPLVAARYRLA